MENQMIDQLEQKVLQVLSVASQARAENQELRLQNQELMAKLEEKERMLLAVRNEVEQTQKARSEVETYKEKQERIRFKIENLIEKLKEFEVT